MCYTRQAGIGPPDLGFLGLTMQQPATVALRSVLVLLSALGMVAGGVVFDRLAGTSPLGALGGVVIAVIWGTVMLLVIVISSFPKPASNDEPDAAGGKPGTGESR
jgi:F0F1-type ATP synthase assembly protein I